MDSGQSCSKEADKDAKKKKKRCKVISLQRKTTLSHLEDKKGSFSKENQTD